MFDLMAVAYEADLTRVFTFMMAREASMKTYPEIGITEPHHTISHHREKPDVKMAHASLNAYHMSMFAKFVEKLKATPDGDGTLLDHSLVFYGSGMSNANVHGPYPLPLVAVGGWQGKGHRHMVTNGAHAARQPVGWCQRHVRVSRAYVRREHWTHLAGLMVVA